MCCRLLTIAAFALSPVLCCADETQVLFDGNGIGDWSTSRDRERLEREFSFSELRQVQDPPALQWRFVSREVAFNDIFLMRPIVRNFDTIRVRVKNEGEGFTLAAKVRDDSGAEWTANRIPLSAGDWRWVEFPRSEWHVASWSRDADGNLDFPLAYFTLIAFDVRPGVEYHLKVASIEIIRPDPPVATVSEFLMPSFVRAGERANLTVSFTLDRPCREEGVWVAFRRGKAEAFRVPIALPMPLVQVPAGEPVRVTLGIDVPRYAWGGPHAVSLRVGEAHTWYNGKVADEELTTVTIEARTARRTVARVRQYSGAPTLFINDQPHNGMAYAAYGPSVEVFSDFTRAGVNLFTFSATPTEAGYGLSRTAWIAPDEHDFSQLDERVMMVLQANPEAYFFPRLYVHAPRWWSEQHPDDIVLLDRGDGKPVPFIHAGGKPAPSWASEAWRRDTIQGLRRLIAHVEESPYADRIIGYHIASGTTEEWMMWGANENEWVDYSPVNVARFRRWLRDKYTTDAALQAAWHDPAVSLDAATIPTRAQRERSNLGALRDPASEQAVIDFYLYNSDLVADTIGVLARAVKEITGGDKIVGVFYGYLLQLCGEQRQQNAGHLALGQVLASPDVDFLCSPTSYYFRQLGGEGTSHFMSLLGSVQAHGKLWFDENDIRTSLSGGQIGEWGRPADIAGDILQQDKELANCLVHGCAQWWFDVGGNRYNDPALMARIGQLTAHATETIQLDRSPVDEVALVVDERSLCYLRVADPLGSWLLVSQLPALQRIGAPVGHYLVTDLPRLRDRKLFILPTSFAPTAQDRQALEALQRDGHVLLFLYAPGLYRDGQLDQAAMEEFTGIRLHMSKDPSALRVTVRDGHPLTAGLAGITYGTDHVTFPIITADDPRAQVLGTLPDGRPGLVLVDHGSWTAVHSAAPLLPTALLQRLAELAGVHRYIETEDVVWASRDLLAVCVKEPGRRTIRLPRQAAVRDIYRGEDIGHNLTTFEADFEARATRLFSMR